MTYLMSPTVPISLKTQVPHENKETEEGKEVCSVTNLLATVYSSKTNLQNPIVRKVP